MIAEYMEAFQSCYPHKTIEVKPKRDRNGEIRFKVIIDQDDGNMLLSKDDMKFATRMFKRGRH